MAVAAPATIAARPPIGENVTSRVGPIAAATVACERGRTRRRACRGVRRQHSALPVDRTT
ncbi:MAG: hypothetical protein ABS81_26415 [Pseudonocardia sp. SCN 72-86]|nr:MAG: hypothetical protein ABS81_26415 [Pseudonocardia sp. SCN 72-86]